jgi:hypothetical protein
MIINPPLKIMEVIYYILHRHSRNEKDGTFHMQYEEFSKARHIT